MTKMVVKIDGDTYIGKEQQVTAEEYKKMMNSLCELAGDVTHLNLELEDGRDLILPREAARRAVWLICNAPEVDDVRNK